jgi:glycosyltransferase involved in cell wall biosynthesis
MKPPPRVIALLSFHNEVEYLADYLSNVSAQVDGMVALDDGSTDGSGDVMAAHPAVLELIRVAPRVPHVWDEPANRTALIGAAAKYRPDWLIALDADERIEREFRQRCAIEIERAEHEGVLALSVNIRELWDSPIRYRSDGNWGSKRHARLFRHRDDAEIDPKALHGHWAPLNSKTNGGYPAGDLNVYHLHMIDAERRRARRERYERLDADLRLQPVGYAHLTDETGLELSPLPVGREYEPLP